MKNKVRRFYNDFYDFIEAYVKNYESKYAPANGASHPDSSHMDKELREYRKSYVPPQREGDYWKNVFCHFILIQIK